VELAAPKSKAAGGRKQLAAALPPAFYFHLEELAATPEASIVRLFARSMILCAWLAIRVQDMQRTKFFLDEDDPVHIVRVVVTCSKSFQDEERGADQPLHAGQGGAWLQELVALLERTGLEKGGMALPDWEGPWGSRSNLAKARRLVEGSTAAPDAIRSIFAFPYLLALPPLS
jgi:hypothetical protein